MSTPIRLRNLAKPVDLIWSNGDAMEMMSEMDAMERTDLDILMFSG